MLQNLKYGTEIIPFAFPDHGEVFHIDEPEISITPVKFAHRDIIGTSMISCV